MARRFAKVSEEEIKTAFFYPSDLVNTKTTIPFRVGGERWIYTYFKKRCRREQRMAVVERKLHDRKELWFHIWFAKTMSSSRGAKLGSLRN